MRLLLDTHVAVWALSRPDRLPPQIVALVADPDNEAYVSVASLWELAIKASLARKSSPQISAEALARLGVQAGFTMLPVLAQHALAVQQLPLLHGDPFDRMLVAQAKSEPMILVTHDRQVAAYDPDFLAC